MAKRKQALELEVQGNKIDILKLGDEDYISLTKMVVDYGGNTQIQNWIRLKDTIAFLGVWEGMNNPDFNSVEFHRIKSESGGQAYILSIKRWMEATHAVGIMSRAGRYGGTYAHKDIAFEFATWLSPTFKLLLIKDFQRLKDQEVANGHWNIRRFLSKAAYKMQANAIQSLLKTDGDSMSSLQKRLIYATEADLLNVLVFGSTAAEWRKINADLAKSNGNQRDYASAKQLLIMTHLESINANMLTRKVAKDERIKILAEEALRQNTTIDEVTLDRHIDAFGNFDGKEIMPAEKPLKIDNPKGFDDTIDKIANTDAKK